MSEPDFFDRLIELLARQAAARQRAAESKSPEPAKT